MGWLIRNKNVRVVAATLRADATPLSEFAFDDRPMLIVVGSEPDGLGCEIEASATDLVTIPMKLGTDSLNVSVAAAILMYEMTKPRHPGGQPREGRDREAPPLSPFIEPSH